MGRLLAERMGCAFYEGDDYHPPSNITKMAGGTPLTDADRQPWLEVLAGIVAGHTRTVGSAGDAVLSCSALKPAYRSLLRGDAPPGLLAFVLLEPGEEELLWRVGERERGGVHFMPTALLRSQLDTLCYEEGELAAHFRSDPHKGFPSPEAIVGELLSGAQPVSQLTVADPAIQKPAL